MGLKIKREKYNVVILFLLGILEKDIQNNLLFKIKYKPSEEGYMLQKFRQLGKRSILIEPRFLVEKMLFTYRKSLERYSNNQS